MAALTSVAVVVFTALYVIDVTATGGPASRRADCFVDYFLFDQDHNTDAVAGLGAMVAAVLGIVVTVVSIVVLLSADRYAGVTSMFLRDRTNLGVMAYYVVTCVCDVWVSLSLRSDFVPRLTLTFMLLLTVVGLVMIAPYFGYVFWFLEPMNITEEPVINNETQVTPAPNGGYDWRGTKLYLNAPLPGSPSQANIYLLKE